MVQEEEFYGRAKKILSIYEKLKQAHFLGKITEEKFQSDRNLIMGHLDSLQKMQFELINGRLMGLEENMHNLTSQMESKLMSQDIYASANKKLIEKQSELESERDMLQITQGEDYIVELKKAIESSRYAEKVSNLKPLTYRHRSDKSYSDDGPPEEVVMATWMWAYITVLALVGIAAGMVLKSPILMIILPILTLSLFWVSCYLLHVSAKVAGIRDSSVVKAMKCQMLNTILSFIAAIPMIIFALIPVLGFIINLVFPVLVFIYCFQYVYRTTAGQALTVFIVNVIIGVGIAVALVVFLVLTGLSTTLSASAMKSTLQHMPSALGTLPNS